MGRTDYEPLQMLLPLDSALKPTPPPLEPLPWVGPEALDNLHRTLASLLGESIDLIGTDNRRSLLSWRKGDDDVLRIRLQRQFALAPPRVWAAIARFVSSRGAGAREVVQEYAATWQDLVAPARPRFGRPAGLHYDLRNFLREQNHSWFDGQFNGRIGWSRRAKGRVRKRIRLGSWNEDHRLIRVHPVLDADEVPPHVINFVVFHEMLHAELGVEHTGERRRVHTREFRRREARHPDHARTEAWIGEHLDSLLSW